MHRSLAIALAAAVVVVGILLARAASQKPGGTAETDEWRKLQTAVESGGVVVLAPGTHRISQPIVIDLDKTGFTAIRGDGAARIVMTGEGPAFRFIGTHAGTAEPKTVKDNVWAKQRMPCIDGVEIVGAHDRAIGIEASGTMELTLCRVLIRKCLHGIHLTSRNRNVIVAECHVYENRGIGVFLDNVNLHQININGSHISYNDGGGVVCVGGEVRNIQISGCDIESNQAVNGPPAANVLIDSTGGANAEVAITGNTIQHARQAPGSANIRIKGPAVPSKGADELREGHITITGNVLSDVKVNIHLDHARGVAIVGNTMWTGVDFNILAEHSSNIVVGANNLDRNPRYYREEEKAADAVMFRDCTDCSITGLQLVGARFAPAGVAIHNCDRFNVNNLTILDCDGAGLWLKNVTRSRVSGCLIRDDRPGSNSIPIRSEASDGTSIVDNTIGGLRKP